MEDKNLLLALNLKHGGGGSGSGLPDVTAEDDGKILQVNAGEWSTSPTKMRTLAPTSSFANMKYVVSYDSDSNQIRLTYPDDRIYVFNDPPVTLTNATISLVQQNVLNIVQSKKWHILETHITPDDETRNFIPNLYSPLVIYDGQTPINISYQGSTMRYFENWEHSDQLNGFLHSYTNWYYESANDEVVITILARYEESV